jgi:hypothetical protein
VRSAPGPLDGTDQVHQALKTTANQRAGQRYMIMEQARRLNGRKKTEISVSRNERDQLSDAATVLDHGGPDLDIACWCYQTGAGWWPRFALLQGEQIQALLTSMSEFMYLWYYFPGERATWTRCDRRRSG